MPVVQITTWPAKNEDEITALVGSVTRAVHESTGAPLDKISVFVCELQPSRWADAGVLGSDPEFPIKSRRREYGDSE